MRRILVVDDSADSREMLEHFLTLQGHTVCTMNDGLDALVAASKFRPEIVFADICMPRMDGYELCARLRANRLTKDAAIFAMTAGSYDKQTHGVKARFDAYLHKPVELSVINELVKSATAQLEPAANRRPRPEDSGLRA
jgi:CheY-like chemotaxis protein